MEQSQKQKNQYATYMREFQKFPEEQKKFVSAVIECLKTQEQTIEKNQDKQFCFVPPISIRPNDYVFDGENMEEVFKVQENTI
jgi:hypothetical protein